jgi:hypothetical protein
MARFRDNYVSVYPHGQGGQSYHLHHASVPQPMAIKNALGNEPFKNKYYFQHKKHLAKTQKLTKRIKSGGPVEPVIGMQHPVNPKKTIVLDGNHRLYAHQQAGKKMIDVIHVAHDRIRLFPHSMEFRSKKRGVILASLQEKTGRYDMNKPQTRLGGKTLNHYFVQANGQHGFNPDCFSGGHAFVQTYSKKTATNRK